jgi:hypothetical protein
LATDLRQARHIAAVEVRRTVRAILASRRKLLGIGLLVLAFAPAAVLVLSGSYAAGMRFAGGTDLAVVGPARAQLSAWLGSLTLLLGLRLVERSADIDHADLVLTTVRPRAAVTGLVLAEFVRVLAVFGLPLGAMVGAFAAGAGRPLMVPVVLAALVPVLAVALLGGFVLSYLARLGYRRLGLGDLRQSGLGLGVTVAVVLAMVFLARTDSTVTLAALEPLAATPVSPYADVLLWASPVAVTPGVDAFVALGILVGTIPLLFAGTWHLAPRVWYADPADDDLTEAAAGSSRFHGVGVPGVLAVGRTTRLVWWQWLRGLRAPGTFVHLLYFVFMGFPALQFVAQYPRTPLSVAFAAVFGALLAGGSFGLNPLGVEGSMLATIATVPSPGRVIVRARILAGVLVWLPVTLLAVVTLGWYTALPPIDTVLVATVAVVLTWFSCTLALALGAAAPRYETVRAFGGVEAPTPTTVALLGHSFGVVVFAVVGLLLVFLPRFLPGPPVAWAGERVLQLGGLTFWAVSAGLVGAMCYRYAVRRLDTFTT